MVKPVVVSVWIYKRFLLMSPLVCSVATMFKAAFRKAIGNATGFTAFLLSNSYRNISACFVPGDSHIEASVRDIVNVI